MTRKYFGTDGVRGRVGAGVINPEFVLKLGWAAGRVLGGGPGSMVLIGKDTRISGYMFESALEAGLVAAGVNIRMLGPMPTPGIAYLTKTLRADAGIVISASHNAYHDNGIKFFSSDGSKLPDEVELAIEAEIDKPLSTVDSRQLGKVKRLDDAPGRYIEFCKSTIPANIRLNGLRIAVDCANGAAYHIAPYVLEELGADVIAIGNSPDGFNINEGFGSTCPEALQETVRKYRADIGIALDGDADRLIIVDENGNLIDGDQILYVIAKSRLDSGEGVRGNVVGTQMSNLGLEQAIRALGLGFERTKVGDRYILGRLLEQDWTLGGESSGHIICRDRTTTGDGMVAALQVLAALVKNNCSASELVSKLEMFPQVMINVGLGTAKAVDVVQNARVQQAVKDVEAKLGEKGRVLLRPSGTEPKIRVMVEGRDQALVAGLAEQLAEEVRAALG